MGVEYLWFTVVGTKTRDIVCLSAPGRALLQHCHWSRSALRIAFIRNTPTLHIYSFNLCSNSYDQQLVQSCTLPSWDIIIILHIEDMEYSSKPENHLQTSKQVFFQILDFDDLSFPLLWQFNSCVCTKGL